MTVKTNESKKKRVHYRKCEIESGDRDLFWRESNHTLEELLDSAFEELEGTQAIHRKYRGNADKIEEFTAPEMKMAKYGECKCGAIFLTQEGKHVPAKGVSEEGVFITNAIPVTQTGESDPVEQIVVFAISGNNLAYISDSNNGDTRLHSFFSWLLQNKTQTLSISSSIHLKNEICINIQEEIERCGVKEMQLVYKPNHAYGNIGDKIKNSLCLPASPIVNTAGGSSLDDCRLKVIISSGSKKNANLEAISKLAAYAAETDLEHLSLTLRNGKKINRDILLPGGYIEISFTQGVINQMSAMNSVSKWLTLQLNEHIIR